jgi:hypothetical protein
VTTADHDLTRAYSFVDTNRYAMHGLQGLGEDFTERAQRDHALYVALKMEVQQLILRYPSPVEPASWESLVRRIRAVQAQDGRALARISTSDLTMILKAALAVTGQNLGQAYAMAGSGEVNVQRNRSQISKLLSTAENVISSTQALLSGISTAEAGAERARRAVGLGIAPVVIAELLAGTVVALVGIAVVGTIVAYIGTAVIASVNAERACELDRLAGRPCTGADRQAYYAASIEESRRLGIIPPLPDIGGALADLIFWGGMAAVAAGIGYMVFIGAPAAREARAGLTERARRWRQR